MTYPTEQENCPGCGFAPAVLEGFRAFAPETAYAAHGGFRPEAFAVLASLESENFWFRARSRLIEWALAKYFPDVKSLLEVGCGTGFVLSGIADAFPDVDLSGSELFVSGLCFAGARVPRAKLMQMDARQIPFKDEFDVIGAFDVVEHIEEDGLVLQQFSQALKPGGGLMITVPQHSWMWSAADDYACHVRRYSALELKRKVETAGFQIVRCASFMSLVFPFMIAARLLNKSTIENFDPEAELKLNKGVNSVMEGLCSVEKHYLGAGFSLPFGGSLLLVARRI